MNKIGYISNLTQAQGLNKTKSEQQTQTMAQDKHQLTASLPLQIMVYYNAIISLVYFLLQAVGVYRKLTNSYTNILPEEVSFFSFISNIEL